MTERNQLPIVQGLVGFDSSAGGEPFLIGSRCKKCREVYFPSQSGCSKCCSDEVEEIALSRRGRVFSSTIVRIQPDQQFYKGGIPYAMGQVELPEQLMIPTIFVDCSLEQPLEIGTEVELVVGKFGEDDEGHDILAYSFRPVHPGAQ